MVKAERGPEARVCWQSHEDHAAVDHTFVQFYPSLKPIAQKFDTYKASAENVQRPLLWGALRRAKRIYVQNLSTPGSVRGVTCIQGYESSRYFWEF